MPLPERVVQPVNVSRGTLSYSVPDELEGVTNGTLANIIRQLSTLSRHAEEMFGNLFTEAEIVAARSSSLQAKIDKLAIRVTQLDSTVEEVSLQDIQLRKAFRSSQAFDQQVVSRDTMPKAMLEAYMACDKPPSLDKLNPYRDDGKDGLKFYTDPNYFFELWRQDMLKDTERMMHDRGKKPGKSGGGGQKPDGARHKKRVRQPHNTAERQKQKMVGRGEFILEQTNNVPGDNNSYQDSGYASAAAAGGNGMHRENEIMANSNGNNYSPDPLLHLQRPNSIEVNRAYEQQVQQQQMQQRMAATNLNTNGSNGYQQEPIYTPHVLRGSSGDEPPSHRYNTQPSTSQQNHYPPTAMFGRTQDNNMESHAHPFNAHPFLEATPATTAAAAQQQQLNQQPQLQQFNPGYQYQQQSQNQTNQSPVGTPSKSNGGQRRPSQPPPAPPPGGTLSPTPSTGTPTRNGPGGSRANSSQRDSLPPPPPPPGTTSTPITGNPSNLPTLSETQHQLHNNLMNGLHHQFNNIGNSPSKAMNMGGGIGSSNQQNNLNLNISNVSNSSASNHNSSITHDDSLPPPPPVPDTTGHANSANNSLSVKMNNLEHLLPPSPPPPPAPSTAAPVTTSSSIIPPPPPPPPSDLKSNGISLNTGNNLRSGNMNGDVNSSNLSGTGLPQKNSILSPPALRKPTQPSHLKAQDGVRSDLLKAIRDGIALKKVEQRQQAKEAENEAASSQTDVATILARRVAVEMSDSEGGGPSDSEYDSDDWGDESTA